MAEHETLPAVYIDAHGKQRSPDLDIVPTQILLTAASGTYIPTSGCIAVIFELIGGGGGGATASQAGGGGGGASGAYGKKLVRSPVKTGYAYTIGRGGTQGNPGTSTTIAGVTAPGGTAGSSNGAAGTSSAGSGGDLNLAGEDGHPGDNAVVSGVQWGGAGGNGGSSRLGGGGRGGRQSAGDTGHLYGGGGGGGGRTDGGNNQVGAVGAIGCILVTEYF